MTSGSRATSGSERRQLEGGNRASLPPDPSLCEEISPTTVSFLSKGAKAPRRQGEPARRAARQARPRRVIRNTGEKQVLRILLISGENPEYMRVFYMIPNTVYLDNPPLRRQRLCRLGEPAQHLTICVVKVLPRAAIGIHANPIQVKREVRIVYHSDTPTHFSGNNEHHLGQDTSVYCRRTQISDALHVTPSHAPAQAGRDTERAVALQATEQHRPSRKRTRQPHRADANGLVRDAVDRVHSNTNHRPRDRPFKEVGEVHI